MATSLPKRDIWLLPLLSLSTVLIMLIGAEIVSRLAWPEQIFNECRVPNKIFGFRYRPDCTSVMKTAEGPWVRNDYNDCGYRSAESCRALAPGHRRVVLLGSSLTEGYMVPYPDTAAARLAGDLTTMCGSPVQVQNLGAMGYNGDLLLPRMQEAVALQPEAIVLLINPWDLENAVAAAPPSDPYQPTHGGESLQHRLFKHLKESRALLVAQHFLFQNPSLYLPLYLRYGDKADFLRPPFSPLWRQRLQVFRDLLVKLSAQAHDAHIRFTLAFVPQEAEIALEAHPPAPAGIDPEALPDALQTISAAAGVAFADASAMLRMDPAPERLFYQVDGHMSGAGLPLVATAVARQIVADPKGAFLDCHARMATNMAENP